MYMKEHNVEKAEHIKNFDIAFVKRMIEWVAIVDPVRWRNFPLDRFNIYIHKAHKKLYHVLRNKYKSLLKAEADAK